MKISDYIVQYLVDQGIERVFLIYGAHNADLIDSVATNSKIDYVCVHHEQAGAMAAMGYYQSSGRVSAMIATSGPGGTNLITGIACCWYDSIPALFITGQVNTAFIKPQRNIRQRGFQENDIVSQVEDITKYAIQIEEAKEIKAILDRAFYCMLEDRPGPVLIDIPQNIQKEIINPLELEDGGVAKENFSGMLPFIEIKEVVTLLRESKRPALLLGGGIHLAKAENEVKTIIHTLKIPTFLTYNALDLLPYDDPFYCGRVGTFGGQGRNFGIQNCDFLLCIGTRISGRITGGMIETFARGAKKIVVDIDPFELKCHQVNRDISIECDARTFINLLLEETKNHHETFLETNEWLEKCQRWRSKYISPEGYWPYRFIRILSSILDEDEIIIFSSGGALVWCSQAWITKKGQRIFTDNGHSSLGYTLPAAIGAAIAHERKKRIIAICGDGDLMFNIQEFQTLYQYDLPVKLFILNNKCYGIAKNYQDTYFDSRYIASGIGYSIPNFMEVIIAFNLPFAEIKKEHNKIVFYGSDIPEILMKENLTENLIDLLSKSEMSPLIINIDMKDMHQYEPHLGWGLPIEMQLPLLPKEEFLENMIIKPVEGWEEIYERYDKEIHI